MNRVKKVIVIFLCVSIMISLFTQYAIAKSSMLTNGIYLADNGTMNSYKDALINTTNGSRYAGRIWTDKSVFTKNLSLSIDNDGYEGTVVNNSDFLHAFSTLGSSLKIAQPTQLDVMFLVDASGSMGKNAEGELVAQDKFDTTAIYRIIDQVNKSIDKLLEKSADSRFGIAVYGATAAVLVPLGHYVKDGDAPFLSVEYEETYGTSQGLHFKLIASVKTQNNEIKKYYADNAGLTSNQAHNTQGNGNRLYAGTGGQTTGTGTEKEPYHVGHITNQQAGLAIAMDQFITGNDEIVWETIDKAKKYPRLPILIHLTDGQASDIAWIQNEAETNSNDGWKKTFSNWNNVNWNYDLAYNSTNNSDQNTANHYNASQLTGLGDSSPIIFQTLMTAAYYKSAVDAYYTSSGLSDLSGNLPLLNCYSVYATTSDEYENMEDTQIKGTLNAVLNPSKYFKDSPDNVTYDSSTLSNSTSGEKFIDTAYELYKLWLNNENTGVDISFSSKTTSSNGSENDITISLKANQNQLTDRSGAYADKTWSNKITVEAIKTNINYVPSSNFYTTNLEGFGNVLSGIIQSVAGNAFTPIDGVNDDGVADSLTYNDPIGKYMEVKDNAVTIDGKTYDMALLLFGELHGIVKTGIYDYNFNIIHRGPTHKSSDLKESFTMGWYDKDDNYLGNTGSWDNGDTYYLDNDTIKQYVPTIDESSNMDADQLSKTYVVYRFNEDATERNKERKNISYGENGNVVYKISDIRIWVERDKSKKEYNNILYANIPATAMPLQVAYAQFNNADKVESYTTNLDNKPASTPLRLFYGVGLDDEILINNNEDIDLTKISEDYIKEHTSEDGYLEFYSNYYSNTPYDGYTADIYDAARTKGDAITTFSPSETNRYYVYQKNLKLYKHAYLIGDNGEIIKEDSPKLFEGADFDGELPGKTEGNLPDEEAQKAIKEAYNNGELKPGDIITLKDDAIKYGEKPSSDDYYYFVIDYVVPTGEGKGETELYVVSRKGSEFGSGILQEKGDKIPIGDFLSWLDISGVSANTYNYSDTIPEAELSKGEWVLTTKIGGLRIGDLHQSVSVKDENITGTSRSYYLPIIADDLSTDGYDAILNTYLGNNGLVKYNIRKYNLPVTGGISIVIFYIIGITLIFVSLCIINRRKKLTKKI